MKVDKVVMKETKYIVCWTLIFSLLMQAVFLIIGQWSYRVLLGNLLGASVAILNFFLLGVTVQKALQKSPDELNKFMKISHMYRNLMVLVVAVIGVVLPCFHTVSVLIPLLFPRLGLAIRALSDRKNNSK